MCRRRLSQDSRTSARKSLLSSKDETQQYPIFFIRFRESCKFMEVLEQDVTRIQHQKHDDK